MTKEKKDALRIAALLIRFRTTQPSINSIKYKTYKTIAAALNLTLNEVQHICRKAFKPQKTTTSEQLVRKLDQEVCVFLISPITLERGAWFTMEVHSSHLHSESDPPLEINRWDQEVYVHLIKFPHKLSTGHHLLRLERLPAYVLNFVLSEVQSSSNSLIRLVLSLLDWQLSSSEPDQKCGYAKSILLFQSHYLILHYILCLSIDYVDKYCIINWKT